MSTAVKQKVAFCVLGGSSEPEAFVIRHKKSGANILVANPQADLDLVAGEDTSSDRGIPFFTRHFVMEATTRTHHQSLQALGAVLWHGFIEKRISLSWLVYLVADDEDLPLDERFLIMKDWFDSEPIQPPK